MLKSAPSFSLSHSLRVIYFPHHSTLNSQTSTRRRLTSRFLYVSFVFRLLQYLSKTCSCLTYRYSQYINEEQTLGTDMDWLETAMIKKATIPAIKVCQSVTIDALMLKKHTREKRATNK